MDSKQTAGELLQLREHRVSAFSALTVFWYTSFPLIYSISAYPIPSTQLTASLHGGSNTHSQLDLAQEARGQSGRIQKAVEHPPVDASDLQV